MYPSMAPFGAKMSAIYRDRRLHALVLFGYNGDLAVLCLTRSAKRFPDSLDKYPAWFSVTLGAGTSRFTLSAEISMVLWISLFHFWRPRRRVIGFLSSGFG